MGELTKSRQPWVENGTARAHECEWHEYEWCEGSVNLSDVHDATRRDAIGLCRYAA